MTNLKKSTFIPYILPFLVFAFFIYAPSLFNISEIYIYPVKTIVTGLIVIYFWKAVKNEISFKFDASAVIAGIFVFIIWVGMEGMYPKLGQDTHFNPFELANGNLVYLVIFFRLLGAVVVVPVIEELFWRSFALRFLIKSDFKSVKLGTFSWFSFIFVSIAFGIEHHRWLPGIIAGAIYAILLYQKKNLFSPILAHAVTNLLLGVYVLAQGHWSYW